MSGSQDLHVVVVTGLSGAGKTLAVRSLEDLGYFCVDNLPPALTPRFIELFQASEAQIRRVALVMDIRGGSFFDAVEELFGYLEQQGIYYEILFLEASTTALVRRFKETRRRHPLLPESGVLEGIQAERRKLHELRGRAHKVIDTSELNPWQLKAQVTELFGSPNDSRLVITIVSFGYKHGIPLDADLVMDVRFLPNPHYIPELQHHTGQEQEVEDYVMRAPETKDFLDHFITMLTFLIPYYLRERKSQLVVAVGCTGGQHRSVVLANHIARAFGDSGHRILVNHRDLQRSAGDC